MKSKGPRERNAVLVVLPTNLDPSEFVRWLEDALRTLPISLSRRLNGTDPADAIRVRRVVI
jgi:hypothetical protein